MPYDDITTAEIAPDKPITSELLNKYKNRDDFLNSGIGSLSADLLQNKNFEIDADSDGQPDGWDSTFFTNGTGSLDTSTSVAGKQSYKFTDPGGAGNGGGRLRSELVPVTTARDYNWAWNDRASVNGIGGIVRIRYYNRNEVFTTDSTLFNSTFATIWTGHNIKDTPPAGAVYGQLELIGGTTVTTVAGDIYFDGTDFRRANTTADMATASIQRDILKTSTNILTGAVSSISTQLTQITLGDYAFFPTINSGGGAGAGANIHLVASTVANPAAVDGTIALSNPLTTASTYTVRWRSITASKGFQSALFYDINGSEKMHITMSDAPPNYLDMFDFMAKHNNLIWEKTTRQNT